jgi:hypothetical protein
MLYGSIMWYCNLQVSFAEARIKEVKRRLEKIFDETGKPRWLDVLDSVAYSINHSIHSAIKMAPTDVTEENTPKVWQTLYDKVVRNYDKIPPAFYKTGDLVRIANTKLKMTSIFTKGYKAKFSQEIFRISKVVRFPNTYSYKLEDLANKPLQGNLFK